jgi:hypothetical protein
MTGVKVLSFGSCTDFFKVPVEKALLSKRHKGELTPSQLTDKRNRGLVTDIYPVGYMCRRTISVTRPCEVKLPLLDPLWLINLLLLIASVYSDEG